MLRTVSGNTKRIFAGVRPLLSSAEHRSHGLDASEAVLCQLHANADIASMPLATYSTVTKAKREDRYENGLDSKTRGVRQPKQGSGQFSSLERLSHSTPPPKKSDIAKALLAEEEHEKGDKTSLAIFDKDGTLICFHSMWTPWALQTAQRIEASTNLGSVDIANEVYKVLGFCKVEQKVKPGLLAEATMPEIKDKLVELLVRHDTKLDEAQKIVDNIWEDCNTSHPDHLKALHDLKKLFEMLRSHGVKVAVCTADSRAGTEPALKRLGLWDMVDVVVCGDDSGAKPKPEPHNALKICEALGVKPEETYMVGDTLADVGMGKRANLGGTIGVLSGVAEKSDLEPHADHIVDSVGDILPILLKKKTKKTDNGRQPKQELTSEHDEAEDPICQERKTIDPNFFKGPYARNK